MVTIHQGLWLLRCAGEDGGRYTVKRRKQDRQIRSIKSRSGSPRGSYMFFFTFFAAIWPPFKVSAPTTTTINPNLPSWLCVCVWERGQEGFTRARTWVCIAEEHSATLSNLFANMLQRRNASRALQHSEVSLQTRTWYCSHASYWCECSDSNKRASLARHMMPGCTFIAVH